MESIAPFCPTCQVILDRGTHVCPHCGTVLPVAADEAGTLEISAILDDRVLETVPPTGDEWHPPGLRAFILNTGRFTSWITAPIVEIGRADSGVGFAPTIDLTGDGGYTAGVSRHHARIIQATDGCYIEDLGSRNGTTLNRRRLPAQTPTLLADGDEIRLGNLVLRITLGH
jgi:hypothetical protein